MSAVEGSNRVEFFSTMPERPSTAYTSEIEKSGIKMTQHLMRLDETKVGGVTVPSDPVVWKIGWHSGEIAIGLQCDSRSHCLDRTIFTALTVPIKGSGCLPGLVCTWRDPTDSRPIGEVK